MSMIDAVPMVIVIGIFLILCGNLLYEALFARFR
jgi:hypothetical protein